MSLLIDLSLTVEVPCSLQGRLLVIHYGQDQVIQLCWFLVLFSQSSCCHKSSCTFCLWVNNKERITKAFMLSSTFWGRKLSATFVYNFWKYYFTEFVSQQNRYPFLPSLIVKCLWKTLQLVGDYDSYLNQASSIYHQQKFLLLFVLRFILTQIISRAEIGLDQHCSSPLGAPPGGE